MPFLLYIYKTTRLIMKNILIASIFSLILLAVYSCSDTEPLTGDHLPLLPAQAYNYMQVQEEAEGLGLPSSIELTNNVIDIVSPGTSFVRNDIISDELATLGRVLFYDNRLSKNNSISCASCHQQTAGFADGQAVSEGFGGEKTTRNSMAIANPLFNETFFWDGRTRALGDLSLQPVMNHVEMGMSDFDEVKSKILSESYYQELFQDAFGQYEVTEGTVSQALASFVASIFKADSKFDKSLSNNFADYTELEKHGMALFFSDQTQCSSCHSGANFSSPTGNFSNPYQQTAGTTNIGLDLVYDDPGFARGKFKIPSLRNIALTAPYMHDGRFKDLRGVLNHYNEEIVAHTDLDTKLKSNGIPKRMKLSELDLDAMEAFLGTLTSETITNDPKYANPFK